MTKRIIALLLALILTVGLLPTVALAAVTDDGKTTDTKVSGADSAGNTDNPVHIVKSVTTDANGNGTLKLEAYVTDPMTIKTSDVPLDIVLVLDQSGSMGFCVNCGAEFSNGNWQKKKCEYTQYVEVGLAKNLTSSSSNEQLYAFESWSNSYDPVEYCDGEQHFALNHSAGWYWGNSVHRSNNRIGSESKLYKKVTTTSENHVHRLDTLKSALESFTQSVVGKATGTPNVKHRVAVVGFSSRQWKAGFLNIDGFWEDYKNTEILTGVNSLSNSSSSERNGNNYYYFPNDYTATNGVQKNAAVDADYKNALVDVSQDAGQTSVANAMKALTACGGTFTDDGLEMAQKIFNANPLTGDDAGRKQIVILFTDGAVDSAHKDGAEKTAAALKDSGVTVYTIGLFEGADQTTNTDDNDFLQKVSSNDGVAPRQGEKSYYLSATDAASLQQVFEQITEEVNKLMLNVGTSAVLSDTLSEQFDFNIPANGDLSDSVTFKLVPVDTKDAEGNYTWKENAAATLTGTAKPTLDRTAGSKSFTVTNFDYGTYKITRVYDQTTGQITGYTGSKLVIEIPIKADTNCKSWTAAKDAYPTNSSTAGAKLEYKDEKNNSRSTGVASPEATVARYSVTYAYGTGSEQPAGVSMPTDTRAYIDGQTIDVAQKPTVPAGYTFDGWYTDAACTSANKVNAANPPAIAKANCTLYGKFAKRAFDVNLSTYFKKYLTLTGVTELAKEENFTITGTEYVMKGEEKEETGVSFTGTTGAIKGTPTEGTAFTGDGMTISLSVGTHSFMVTETAGTTNGMTYAQPKDITITVAAKADGSGADVTVSDGTITNTYKPADSDGFTLNDKFQKTLVSNVELSKLPAGANSFELKIWEGTDTTADAKATGTAVIDSMTKNAETGKYTGSKFFNFGTDAALIFTEAKEYTYTVKETVGTVAGMQYDTNTYTLTIKVVNNNGKFEVESANIGSIDMKDGGPLTITNAYTKPTYAVGKFVIESAASDDFPTAGVSADDYQYPSGGKYIVEKTYTSDTITFLYVIKVSGNQGAVVKVQETDGGEFAIKNSTDSRASIVWNETEQSYTVTLNQEVDASNPIKLYAKKTFTKVEGKFPATATNALLVNGEDGPEQNTTIEERGTLTVDFGALVHKHLTVTGDKAFNGATFTVNFTEGLYAPLAVNNSIEVYADAGVGKEDLPDLTASVTYTADERNLGLKDFDGADLTINTEGNYSYIVSEEIPAGATGYDTKKYVVGIVVDIDGDGLKVTDVWYHELVEDSAAIPESIPGGPTFYNTIDTGKDDYYPIIIPSLINKDTGMLNKTDHFAYVIGYPDGTVHPNGQITRAEVATIFFRLLRDEVRDGAFTTSNSYSDVAYGKWYNNPISTMSALGIITGYPDGTFKPDKPITRAEFAAIAARFDETQSGKSATFSDVIGHWAAKEIGIAYYNDWIKGYPDGTFKPDQNITRAEAMTLINRVLERKPESPADLLTDMNIWTDNMDTSKWYYLDVQEATNSHGYTRKTFNYELWRQMLNDPDWSRYER